MSSSPSDLRRQLSARRLAVFGGTATAAVLTAIASGLPATALLWAALLAGAVLAGLLAALLVPVPEPPDDPDEPDDPTPDDPAPDDLLGRVRRLLREHWKLAAAAGAVLGLLLTLGAQQLIRSGTDCPPATQLRLVTDPETITTARRLATGFERATARANDGCPTARIYAYSTTDATSIRNRLQPNDGWSDNYGALSRVGPRPDIWLASTGHQVDLVTGAADGASPIEKSTAIARSPLVLAVPAAAADQEQRTWSEHFRRLSAPAPHVVRGNPASDDLDMLATIPLYESKPADGGARPGPPEIERRIQVAADAGRFPIIGDATDLLCHRRQLTADGAGPAPPGALDTAIIATEQQVIRYNAGEPLGGSCGTATAAVPGDRQLRAVYPTDTVDQDLQFARLRWSSPAQKQAVGAFESWLGSDAGERVIVQLGLRPEAADYPLLEPLTPGSGVDPSQSPPSAPVDLRRWQAANEAREQARRPSDLLFAVDSSGSMAAVGPNGTRQEVAAAAILSGLTGLGPFDAFGLWTFPDGTDTGHIETIERGPRDPARLAAAAESLRKIRPAGNTPLYRTMVDGVETLARADPATDEAAFQALVVLTDGEDTTSGIDAAEAVRTAAARNVRIVVVTVGEVRCSNPGLIAITSSTGNACVDADPSDLDAKVAEVVAELKGGG